MATLFNTKIKDTYQSLLKLEDNTILTTTVKNVTDGLGNASPLYMSTTRIGIGTNAPTVALEINGHFVQNASGYGIATNTILNTTIDYYQYGGHQFRSWGASGAQTVMRITGSGTDGKVLIGTTTDAGYKLDVNGTARFVNNITYNGNLTPLSTSSAYSVGLSSTSTGGRITAYTNNGASSMQYINFGFNNTSLVSSGGFTDPTHNGVGFALTNSLNYSGSGGGTYTSFLLNPTLNFAGNPNAGIYRAIYYNPTLTNLTNATHIAFENTTGNVLLGTTSGNVGIGTSSPTNKLEVVGATRISTSLNVGGDGSTGSSFSSGFIAYDTGNSYAHSLVHAQAAQLFLFANPQGFAIAGYEPASSGLSASNLAFMTSSSTRMKILSNGNVLIGTTTDSGYKLDVNGSTRVKGNTLTVSASGLSSVPANYVGINFDDNPNHHEYWFAINSKKDLYGAIGIGYDRIIFPTMGNDNSTWEFNALGSYSRIKIAARNNTAGNFLDLNNSSISFCGSWTIASIDRTNRKLVFGNMSTDVHHIGVYDLVIKGAQPFEGNAGGSIANGGNVYVVGGTPSTSPTGNYGNVILAHDGTAARGNVLIGTTTDSGFKLDVNGTARVNGVLTVGSSTITGNFGAMTLSNNGVAGVSLYFTNNSFGSSNPCILGDQGYHAHSSSQLEIKSTAKGFLPPRMTSTQRNAISSPATGLQVYDTTQNAICEYTGTAWRTISGGKQILTATTGATTVDLSLGNVTDVTLTLSTVITLSNPTVGTYVIKLIQDSIGGKTVSWPFNVLWSGSTPPTLTATANKTDVITLVYDGVNYYGTYALNF